MQPETTEAFRRMMREVEETVADAASGLITADGHGQGAEVHEVNVR